MDHIHVINQVIQKSEEYNKTLYMAFRDYEKAFDSIDTAEVLETLKDQGIEVTYTRFLDEIYKGCTGRIIFLKQSEKFPIRKGVRHGDTISPKLFTSCLEGIFRKLNLEGAGLRINGEYLSHLRIANDIILFSQSAEHLQKFFRTYSCKVGPL